MDLSKAPLPEALLNAQKTGKFSDDDKLALKLKLEHSAVERIKEVRRPLLASRTSVELESASPPDPHGVRAGNCRCLFATLLPRGAGAGFYMIRGGGLRRRN